MVQGENIGCGRLARAAPKLFVFERMFDTYTLTSVSLRVYDIHDPMHVIARMRGDEAAFYRMHKRDRDRRGGEGVVNPRHD